MWMSSTIPTAFTEGGFSGEPTHTKQQVLWGIGEVEQKQKENLIGQCPWCKCFNHLADLEDPSFPLPRIIMPDEC